MTGLWMNNSQQLASNQTNGNQQPSTPSTPIPHSPISARRSSSNASTTPPTSGTNEQQASIVTTTKEECEPLTKVLPDLVEVDIPRENKEGNMQNTRYSSACEDRPASIVKFNKQTLTKTYALIVGQRLNAWEPFWRMTEVLALGVTSPIDKCTLGERHASVQKKQELQTAAVMQLKNGFGKDLVTYWGKESASPPQVGDRHILLRMLPLKLDEKTQKKRADCHQWPKGTYLMINGTAIELKQRKQQAHDHSYWIYQSYHLDVARYIKRPEEPCTIAIATQDTEQFVFCIALCKYASPPSLIKRILAPSPQGLTRPSFDEMKEKAIQIAKQSVATLIEDSDDDDKESSEEQGKFVFSVYCPVTKKVLENPVRGKNCKHFQVRSLQYAHICRYIISKEKFKKSKAIFSIYHVHSSLNLLCILYACKYSALIWGLLYIAMSTWAEYDGDVVVKLVINLFPIKIWNIVASLKRS